MKNKRLSDTAALAAIPGSPSDYNESVDVSVRRIENGFVTRVSRCGPDGYISKERFSTQKPPLADPDEMRPDDAVGSESLRDAIASLK